MYVVWKVGKWLGKERRKEGMHALRVHEASKRFSFATPCVCKGRLQAAGRGFRFTV